MINISVQKYDASHLNHQLVHSAFQAVFMHGSLVSQETIELMADQVLEGKTVYLCAPDEKQTAVVIYNLEGVGLKVLSFATEEQLPKITENLEYLLKTYASGYSLKGIEVEKAKLPPHTHKKQDVTTIKVQLGENSTVPLVRECLEFTLSKKTPEERKGVLRNLFSGLPEYMEVDRDCKELPAVLNNLRLANLKVEIV